MPTLAFRTSLTDVVMIMKSTEGELRGISAIDYESATAAHIEQTIENRMGTQVFDLGVTTNIVSQKVVSATATIAPGVRYRYLQTTVSPLEIGLDVSVKYRTYNDTAIYDPSEWIKDAFNSEEERNSYMDRLKQKNSAFQNVQSVQLTVDGFVPIEEPPENVVPGEDSGNLGIIIGAAVGGVIVMALAALYISRRNNSGGGGSAFKEQNLVATTASTAEQKRLATEILMEQQDDVSTLGDPMFGTGGMAVNGADRDERTASVADDYDYAKEYLLGQQGMEDARDRMNSIDSGPSGKTSGTSFTRTGSGPVGTDVFADDASFMQQYAAEEEFGEDFRFAVDVPPGKLGMVIDTPNGGVPVVHAIKPESILANKVHVGDRLVSVDDEDVTSMTAVQVSKLISIKSEQQRILVFIRKGRVDSL
jgi:hypothetical protein